MPNRILREGILRSEAVAQLSPQAELFYRRLMSIVDDYGRYYGKPELLLSDCYPIRPSWADVEGVSKWLAECERADLLLAYDVGSSRYIEIGKFRQRTRTPSKFPEPPNSDGSSQPSGKVYFFRAAESKKIKIGFTEWKPELRMLAVQSDVGEKLELLGWFPGTRGDESSLHKMFCTQALGNEWFTSSAELLLFIARKCQQETANDVSESQKMSSRARTPTPTTPTPTTTPTTTPTEGGQGETKLLPRSDMDELFVSFREAYAGIGAVTTEADWQSGYWAWKILDSSQKLAAVQHVATCDPAFIRLPRKYLETREWERAPRPAPKSKLDKTLEAL